MSRGPSLSLAMTSPVNIWHVRRRAKAGTGATYRVQLVPEKPRIAWQVQPDGSTRPLGAPSQIATKPGTS